MRGHWRRSEKRRFLCAALFFGRFGVALLSRKTDYACELASDLETAKAYACDVTDPAAIKAAFASVRAELGDVDALIYNAGSGVWGNIEEISAADFEQSWRVNTMGAFLAA